jgi:hypothetical protein
VGRLSHQAAEFREICAAAIAASNHDAESGIEELIPVLDSIRTRSNRRFTPTFGKMDRSWVRIVVI